MGDVETISAEEYAAWMPVADALRLQKSPDWEKRVDQFLRRLWRGHLKAAAHHADQDGQSINFLLIDKEVWGDVDLASRLWSTGDTTIFLPDDDAAQPPSNLIQTYGYKYAAGNTADLFGVRLKPIHLGSAFAPRPHLIEDSAGFFGSAVEYPSEFSIVRDRVPSVKSPMADRVLDSSDAYHQAPPSVRAYLMHSLEVWSTEDCSPYIQMVQSPGAEDPCKT